MNFETEPAPEFLNHLEWQVRTAARRESRFARPVASRGWRGVRAAAALLLAFAIGAGGVFAAQRLQQSREAEVRAAQWKLRLELAGARLSSATAERDAARTRFESGFTSHDELALAELERTRLVHAFARVESEAAEVVRTGSEPLDRLSAPLVDGKDFVRERLELEAAGATEETRAAEELRQAAEARHAAGVSTDAELREAELRGRQARVQQELVARRMQLRESFVAGGMPAEAVEREELRSAARSRAGVCRAVLDAARAELENVKRLVEAGALSESALRAAERRVAEAEGAMRLAVLELRMFEPGKDQR